MIMEPEYSTHLWERALTSFTAAKANLIIDPDTAANRAYYAAFNAISALFALEGQYFRKHSGVQSALHKQLIHTSRLTEQLGSDYDKLIELRAVADYGAAKHVFPEKAELSIGYAHGILLAIHNVRPEAFPIYTL